MERTPVEQLQEIRREPGESLESLVERMNQIPGVNIKLTSCVESSEVPDTPFIREIPGPKIAERKPAKKSPDTEDVSAELAKAVLNSIRLLESKGLTRDMIIALIAEELPCRIARSGQPMNWSRKKSVVEFVLNAAERVNSKVRK